MNKISIGLCYGILLLSVQAFSQKVDIDNAYFSISNCELPLNYIEPEKRTYKVFLSGNSNFTGADKQQDIKIHGWQRVGQEDPATVDIKVTIGSFTQGIPTTSSETQENKDKDGKVTSKTVSYFTSATNTGNGNVVIDAIKNEMPPMKKVSEKESKNDKREHEKEKEKPVNPFLKNVNLAGENTMVSNEKVEAYTYSLQKDYVYTTSKYSTAIAAQKAFSEQINSAKNGHQNEYRDSYVRWVNNFVNSKYGYAPVNHYVKFKKLDSKKHPENEIFNAAVTATGEIFKKMRFNKNPEEIRNDLLPVLNYFDEVTKKYAGEDKENVKLRGAAIYNQARINQFLDNHDKVIELTKELALCGKKNEKAAGKFVEESNMYKGKLAFHKMSSRHNYISAPAEDEDYLGETVQSEDED